MNIIKNEGVWRLHEHHAVLILTDEKQLDRIIDGPDVPIFYDDQKGHSGESVRFHNEKETLNSFCENAAKHGAVRVEVSYDFFFGGTQRHNYPDSETTIKAFKAVRDIAKKYGMAFGASLISPLDIGGNYRKTHSDGGIQCQYLETCIAADGSYKADMVLQRQWYNNKGPITLSLAEVRAYAFTEERYAGTCYFYVDPDSITDISETVIYTVHEDSVKITGAGYGYGRLEVSGKWKNPTMDRILLVAVYHVPEIDYFSDNAFDFMKGVIDTHAAAGIDYGGFYSDEMHIQFDWDLGMHFGETEINSRYLTVPLETEYSRLYGPEFKDMMKYLIYFAYHQHDFLNGAEGKEPAQHIFEQSDEGVYKTWLFRKRYFELLQTKVVDLSIKAKEYAENLFGAPIMTRAHATWQESPTCDHYYKPENPPHLKLGPDDVLLTNEQNHIAKTRSLAEIWKEMGVTRYDYTPNYDWSSSIRENISACYDYFMWNDFLTGAGNDHPEGSNTDRNYFGQALACSFGSLNKYEQAYCASWGSPQEIIHRFTMVVLAYGNPHGYNIEQGMQHRKTDVLVLYPLELNYVEERYGSWMTQYGYCNYITEAKLLERAVLDGCGQIKIDDYTYRALVIMYAPFISEKTMALLENFVSNGGKLLWQATWPVMSDEGGCILERFKTLFGIDDITPSCRPHTAMGQSICFTGSFDGIAPMPVITDLLPDYIYPIEVSDGEAAAYLGNKTVAAFKRYNNNGAALYCGFRPRDDQSVSLGYDIDTLFRLLERIGAYNENSLEVKSRPADAKYVMNSFPNGAVAVANHYRTFDEAWDGQFFRNRELDIKFLEGRELPPLDITFDDEMLENHRITYAGENLLIYNYIAGGLTAYRGQGTGVIKIDDIEFKFADRPVDINWGKIRDKFVCDDINEVYILNCRTPAKLMLPIPLKGKPRVELCVDRVFTAGSPVPFLWHDGILEIEITDELKNRRIAIYS
ncbi:MAG: hypothetical protein ACYCWE_08535 [Eubacteriales bacterium]